jgi:nucleotide-binding universal stress UspA family protein
MEMYENILVTLDGSDLAESALPHMEIVYKGCEKPKVKLLRVVEPMAMPYGEAVSVISIDMIKEAEAQQQEAARKYLKDVSIRLGTVGIPVTTEVLLGRPADEIVDYVNKNNVDLLIMATHGRSGVGRWVWGSVADRTLRNVCIPVMLIRAPGCGIQFKEKLQEE